MLAGTLTEFTLLDVLMLLATTHKTGVLEVDGVGGTGRVVVADGDVVFATADDTRAPLAARLVHSGEVAIEDLEAIVHAHRIDAGTGVGAALVAAGMGEERAAALVGDQVVDAVADLSCWPDGQFAFTPSEAPSDTGEGGAERHPAADVMNAARALAEERGAVAERERHLAALERDLLGAGASPVVAETAGVDPGDIADDEIVPRWGPPGSASDPLTGDALDQHVAGQHMAGQHVAGQHMAGQHVAAQAADAIPVVHTEAPVEGHQPVSSELLARLIDGVRGG